MTPSNLSPNQQLLLEAIIKTPQKFEFFQALRMIYHLSLQSDATPNSPTLKDVVRFKSKASLVFPVSDISQIKWLNEGANALVELQSALGGLYGAHGLLPFHYTELIMVRLQSKDTHLRDFLDQLNQHLFAVMYEAWKKNHFFVGYEQARLQQNSADCFTHLLDCLTGQGIQKLSNAQTISAESILFYAGSFANQRRSASQLKNILADYFQIPVTLMQFQTKQIRLDLKNRTQIGSERHNNQLGMNTVLGMRLWDCQNHFRVCLGPLTYAQFQTFLPGEKKLNQLLNLSRRYVGMGLSVEIQLLIQIDEVPACQLNGKIRLGYDSWLNSRYRCYEVERVVLRPRN